MYHVALHWLMSELLKHDGFLCGRISFKLHWSKIFIKAQLWVLYLTKHLGVGHSVYSENSPTQSPACSLVLVSTVHSTSVIQPVCQTWSSPHDFNHHRGIQDSNPCLPTVVTTASLGVFFLFKITFSIIEKWGPVTRVPLEWVGCVLNYVCV